MAPLRNRKTWPVLVTGRCLCSSLFKATGHLKPKPVVVHCGRVNHVEVTEIFWGLCTAGRRAALKRMRRTGAEGKEASDRGEDTRAAGKREAACGDSLHGWRGCDGKHSNYEHAAWQHCCVSYSRVDDLTPAPLGRREHTQALPRLPTRPPSASRAQE